MQYKTGDTEEFEGVGRIWKAADGWYFETVYGHEGGPMQRGHAIAQMDCQWATHNKEVVGIENGCKRSVKSRDKQRQLWQAQSDLLRVAWR